MSLSLEKELSRFFSYVAPKYEAHTHALTLLSDQRWRRFTINCLYLKPGDKLLDLATGTGQLARLAARHPARPKVYALDSNRHMLALAAQKARGLNIEFVLADARQSGLPAASFQAVTMGFGLRIMPDRPALLKEIHRLLKPGGRVYFLETASLHGAIRKILFFLRPYLPNMLQYIDSRLLGYRHLLDSMLEFPGTQDLQQLFISQGFVAPRSHSLSPALAHLHIAEKPCYSGLT